MTTPANERLAVIETKIDKIEEEVKDFKEIKEQIIIQNVTLKSLETTMNEIKQKQNSSVWDWISKNQKLLIGFLIVATGSGVAPTILELFK